MGMNPCPSAGASAGAASAGAASAGAASAGRRLGRRRLGRRRLGRRRLDDAASAGAAGRRRLGRRRLDRRRLGRRREARPLVRRVVRGRPTEERRSTYSIAPAQHAGETSLSQPPEAMSECGSRAPRDDRTSS